MKPIIGITTAWSIETWGESEVGGYYYVGKPYVEAITNANGLPILLTPDFEKESIDKYIDQIISLVDGIIFTGGGDAKKFSKENLPSLKKQQPERYYFESKLMKKAWDKGIPVLGICRGYQMIIEVFGGSLSDKTINGHKQNIPGYESWHKVNVKKGSLFYNLLNESEWAVNSFHIQAVDNVPHNFITSIVSEDGIIEGVETESDRFFAGVQFHPEELTYKDKRAERFFSEFIKRINNNKEENNV